MPSDCLWHESTPPPPTGGGQIPERADVAVVGGGYTGLAAARALARAGVSVAVLEKESLGAGASTRNGGFVLPGFQLDMAVLVQRLGLDRSRALYQDSLASIDFLKALIGAECIDCDFDQGGHITVAESPRQYRALAASSHLLNTSFGAATTLLGERETRHAVGSPRYCGGLLDPLGARVHPARLLSGLGHAAAIAGATLVTDTIATRFRRRGSRTVVESSRGRIEVDQLILATNGYSGPFHPGLRRRIVPIGSHIVATAPLSNSLAAEILPGGRVVSDSRNLLHYFRISPDRRLVFGGRASFMRASPARLRAILQRDMTDIFPQLSNSPIEFAWSGNVGFTRDHMPHAGRVDGILCAGGYCGHGVAMATYLGDRLGQHVASGVPLPAVAALDFPLIPLYNGHPWFLPLAGGWYRFRDWLSQ
ncbi:MAG: FAD-binding oxidoreductase [Gemmatimonadota bacterium]